MKLELKHLAPYLPYGLKGISTEENLGIETIKGFSIYGIHNTINIITNVDDIDIELFKPILRPLLDLTKEIEVNGEKFVPVEKIAIHLFDKDTRNYILDGHINAMPYWVVEKLLEYHFDIFNLIEQGLAISIHDVNQTTSS